MTKRLRELEVRTRFLLWLVSWGALASCTSPWHDVQVTGTQATVSMPDLPEETVAPAEADTSCVGQVQTLLVAPNRPAAWLRLTNTPSGYWLWTCGLRSDAQSLLAIQAVASKVRSSYATAKGIRILDEVAVDHPVAGIEFLTKDSGDRYSRERYFVQKDRLYVLGVGRSREAVQSSAAERFLSSLRLASGRQ